MADAATAQPEFPQSPEDEQAFRAAIAKTVISTQAIPASGKEARRAQA